MAEYIVDSLSDLVDGNHGGGELTLREALVLANAAPGMDRIGFAASLAGATIRLTQGPLEIADDLVLDGDIDGDGHADITLSGDANGDDATMLDGFGNTITDAASNTASADNSAVLRLTGAAATLHGLVITGGVAGAGIEGGGIAVDAGSSLVLTASSLSGNRAGGNGGGIAAEGAVTLDGSLIEGNVSQRRGGGIAAEAALVATGSTISGNSALFDGGGVFAMPGATLTLADVTVSGNAAYRGAGLLSYGMLTAINTTIAHNAAGNYGGGLFNRGNAELIHATVTGNSGTYGGGIYNAAASLTLTNSLITGNSASGYGPEIAFGAVTNRNSIIGGAAASIFAALDPETGGGALAANGGPVATVALADDSRNPARDGGTRDMLPADALDLDGDGLVSELLPVDARGAGYLRRQSARPDLGAFELGPVPVRIEITEIMADADAAGSDWQWIEIMNTGSMTVDLTGWVLDDDDGTPLGAANISAGSVESGAVAVLYNADAVTAAGFAAAWGSGIPLIAVSGWPELTPGQGIPETVSLWDSFASYSGDDSAHANAVATVSFASGGDFPDLATGSSVHRRDLTDPSLAGAAWALSQAGTDGAVAADGTATGSGSDAGSPGTVALPAFIVDHEAATTRETAEDQPLTLAGLGFDRFLASGSAPVTLTAIATQGSVDIGGAGASAEMTLADLDALAAAGGIVYTPDADFSGADTILLTLDEVAPGGLAPETLAISVTVTPVDDPPVAFADEAPAIGAFSGTASTLAIFPLADNGNGADLDADGDPLTIASLAQPGIGSVSLNGDRIDFSLPAGALPALPFGARASTSFTYTLDGGGVAEVHVPIVSGGDIVPIVATGPTGTGTAGSDVILLSEEDEAWSGGEGADILLGNLGNDMLRGDDGGDLLFGEAGDDTLEGGAGDDVLAGGRGADSLNGGAGRDTASYAGAVAGVRVDLLGALANLGEAAGDSFAGIEIHEGSAFDDDLRGSAGIETLLGGDGNDLLVGRGSVDVLEGGSGNDTVLGGGGPDVLSGGAGADFIRGDAGIDRLLFAEAVTVDLAVRENNTGEAAGDTILLVEILDGSAFADDLRGDAEANILRGRDGADTLRGRGGDDTLEGGRGADILIGQNGSDSFLFTGPNQGPDTINDFEPGTDRIAITGAVFGGLAPGALDASRFVTGTATDNQDQLFRYDPAKGRLFYDADGSGAEAARLLAILAGQPAISASDIEVV